MNIGWDWPWYYQNAEIWVTAEAEGQGIWSRHKVLESMTSWENRIQWLFYWIFLKHSAKEDISPWVWKSFRTLHWRGAWQLVRLWTPHDNPIPDADIGYYVNFTRFCILTVCSQQIRVLMSNDFKCLEIPHTDAPPKFLYKLSPTKQVINLLAGKYFPVSCRWGKKFLQ